jgi:uncharacterized protein (TIGR03382 family)
MTKGCAAVATTVGAMVGLLVAGVVVALVDRER